MAYKSYVIRNADSGTATGLTSGGGTVVLGATRPPENSVGLFEVRATAKNTSDTHLDAAIIASVGFYRPSGGGAPYVFAGAQASTLSADQTHAPNEPDPVVVIGVSGNDIVVDCRNGSKGVEAGDIVLWKLWIDMHVNEVTAA